MSQTLQRGSVLDQNTTVRLMINLTDQNGNGINADSTPTIAIIQPGGEVFLINTTNGVKQLTDTNGNVLTGKYYYDFYIPIGCNYGVWNDVWTAVVQGNAIPPQTYCFIVTGTEIPANPSSDGLLHLGDMVPFAYSQLEIANINKLMFLLKQRLNSDGKTVSKDAWGNTTYVTCSNFSIETLMGFLELSLSEFNLIPYTSNITFADTDMIHTYATVIVEAAGMFALYAKSAIERGSEFTIQDNGISFAPAQVAEFLKISR